MRKRLPWRRDRHITISPADIISILCVALGVAALCAGAFVAFAALSQWMGR